MSDEASSAPAEAPAVEASAAIEAAPEASGTNFSSDGPASEATSPVSEATPSVEGEVTASPYDSYDWDSWDGKHESWPEEYQSWGAKLHGSLDQERGQLAASRGLYEKLLQGTEDPRFADLNSSYQELQTQHQALEAKWGASAQQTQALNQQLQDYKRDVRAAYESETTAWVDRFERQHADIFSDKKLESKLVEVLQLNVDPDDAVDIIRLGEEPYTLARKALQEGASPKHALQLAHMLQEKGRTVPRAGAQLTSGASRRAVPNQTKNIERRKPTSFTDIRNFAVEKAFAKQRK